MTTVLTIKSKAGKREKLIAQANEVATDLLGEQSDRVLVVYDQRGARIYCEGERQSPEVKGKASAWP